MRENRKFTKLGKMAMKQIYKPPVKREEVKKNDLTQDEKDFISYGIDPELCDTKNNP